MTLETADLTPAELVRAARGHAIDLGLVEASDRTLHLPTCAEVRDRHAAPLRIPLETIDCFPVCEWCLLHLNTPSLGAIVRLGEDIAEVTRVATHPSAAVAVAIDGLDRDHRKVRCEFHPALAEFGESHHRLNGRAIRDLRRSLDRTTAAGQLLYRSALRMALLEATVATILGATPVEGAWTETAALIHQAAEMGEGVLARTLLDIATYEGVRTVARPASQAEWSHVRGRPNQIGMALRSSLGLQEGSLEEMTAELVLEDLVVAIEQFDLDALHTDDEVEACIDPGPLMGSPGRVMAWRRGRIHWLRGLVDLGVVGTVISDSLDGRVVAVPSVVAGALAVPMRWVGASPIRAAGHRLC